MASNSQPKKKTKWIKHLALIIVLGGGLGYFAARMMKSQDASHADHAKEQHDEKHLAHSKHEKHVSDETNAGVDTHKSPFFHSAKEVMESIQAKVDELRKADEENSKLRLENTHLRLKLEATQYECDAKLSAVKTRKLGDQLKDETGSAVGRTLASIHYQIPEHLNSEQLYVLGSTYFNAREDEKAAAIFTFLTRLEDNTTYKTPYHYLMTGVTWYRLEHYELARMYFERVLEAKEDKSTLPYHAQARLWMALVNERVGHHKNSQAWLKELIDYHPHSTEAEWVNTFHDPREVARVPSSEDHE